MKFYFCETCGKRLTENDVADGAARDKKLKGVYCRECAIGVTTMDTLPLSDEKARQLLQADEGKEKAPTSAAARRERRSSGRAQLRTGKGVGSGTRIPAPSRPSGGLGMPLAAGAGVVVLLVALFFLFSGGEEPRSKTERKHSDKESSSQTIDTVKQDTPVAEKSPPVAERGSSPVTPADTEKVGDIDVRTVDAPKSAPTTASSSPPEKAPQNSLAELDVSGVPPGMLVRYRFDEGSGATVRDSSGRGTRLDLRIPDINNVTWSPTGLTINRPTLISSTGPATRIVDAILKSQAFSMEAVVTQSEHSGTYGVIFQMDAGSRAFSLQSSRKPRDLRFIGIIDRTVPSVMDGKEKHIVVRAVRGKGAIFVNGVERGENNWRFDLSAYVPARNLYVGARAGLARPWFGSLRFAAIYDRALTDKEIAARHQAFMGGGTPAAGSPKSVGDESGSTAGAKPPPGPDPSVALKTRREAYEHLDRIAALLVSGSANEAVTLADEKQKAWGSHADEEHRKHAPAFAAAGELGRQLQAREAAVRTALKKRIGRETTVLLKRGRQRGKLQKVGDAGLTLECQSIINGKVVKTYTSELAWSKLSTRFLDGFAKKWAPPAPTETLLEMLRILSPAAKPESEKVDRAAELLEKAKDNALAPYLIDRIGIARLGAVEVAAKEDWGVIRSAGEAKNLSEPDALRLLKKIARYEREHGKTRSFAETSAALPALRHRCAAVAYAKAPATSFLDLSIEGLNEHKDDQKSGRNKNGRIVLWAHAVKEGTRRQVLTCGGKYHLFEVFARQDDKGCKTPLTFEIVADGQRLWKSEPARVVDDIKVGPLCIIGVQKLELLVHCPGKNSCAHSQWIDGKVR